MNIFFPCANGFGGLVYVDAIKDAVKLVASNGKKIEGSKANILFTGFTLIVF